MKWLAVFLVPHQEESNEVTAHLDGAIKAQPLASLETNVDSSDQLLNGCKENLRWRVIEIKLLYWWCVSFIQQCALVQAQG
jgi:hypothetical protein